MRHYWWERIDIAPSEKTNVHDFMEEKQFTWKVISLPCFAFVDGKYVEINRHRVCARSDDYNPMFVVKKQYKLLSNEDCFQIMNKFKEAYAESKFVSCGDIVNQKKSYLTMLLKKIKLCSDEYSVYLTVTNGFDGRNAVNCTLTLMRDFDHAVFQVSDSKHERTWTLGRMNIESKFDFIHNEIERYLEYADKICREMISVKITLNDVLNPMFALNWKKSKSINLHMAEEKEYIREIYLKRKGKNIYDLYLAICSYYCNFRQKRNGKLGDDIRFDFAMCGYFNNLYKYGKYFVDNYLNKR